MKKTKSTAVKDLERDAALRRCDALLGSLGEAEAAHAAVAGEYGRALSSLKALYAEKLAPLKAAVDAAGKDIEAQAKASHAVLFDGTDQVTLAHGLIRFAESKVVVKARGVTVEGLEALGYLDGVKIEKSVDWDALQLWPDEKLIAAGTERKEKRTYSWELNQKEQAS